MQSYYKGLSYVKFSLYACLSRFPKALCFNFRKDTFITLSFSVAMCHLFYFARKEIRPVGAVLKLERFFQIFKMNVSKVHFRN